MNKLIAILLAILFTFFFVIVRPLSVVTEALYECRLMDFGFFVQCVQKNWNDPKEIQFKDVVELIKDTWRGNETS